MGLAGTIMFVIGVLIFIAHLIARAHLKARKQDVIITTRTYVVMPPPIDPTSEAPAMKQAKRIDHDHC